MPGLISDQLLRNLRVVANKQLTTPVTVQRVTRVEGPYGTEETLAVAFTTLCWYKPSFKGNLGPDVSGLIVHDSGGEFRFDIDTDIRVGDVLQIGDHDNFIVQDNTAMASIQLYLKAWAVRLEPSPDG